MFGHAGLADGAVSGSEHPHDFALLAVHGWVLEIGAHFNDFLAFVLGLGVVERTAATEGNQQVQGHRGVDECLECIVLIGHADYHVVVKEEKDQQREEHA